MNHFTKLHRLTAVLLMLVLLITAAPVAFAESFSAYVKSSSMAVYSDAALSKKLGALDQFTVVTVKAYSGGVAKISYLGKTGYAKVSAMEAVKSVAEPMVVNTATKVYSKPSTSSDSVNLAKGTKVNMIVANGAWALIEKDGVGGYTNLGHLTKVSAVTAEPTATSTATPAPTATPDTSNAIAAKVSASSVTVYQSASTSSKSLGTLKKGASLNVLATKNGWAYVERSGNYGFCKLSALTPANATTTATAEPTATPAPTATPDTSNAIAAKVSASSVTVYQSASTSSKSLGTLKKGASLNVLATKNGWAYVERSGNYGFCKLSALTPANATATATAEPTATPAPTATPDTSNAIAAKVSASSVTVYQSASTSSKSLGTLKKGASLNVLTTKNGWAYVERSGNYGFCKLSALTPANATATATPEAKAQAVVNANTKVYKKASTSSASASVKKGTWVDVLAVSGSWAYIRSSAGVYAYIPTKYLSADESEDYEITQLDTPVAAVVTADKVTVRSEPGTGGSNLGSLKKGVEVKIVATVQDGSYVKIDLNGKQGWCAIGGLGPVEEEEEKDPLEGYTKETFDATIVTNSAKFYDVAGEGDGVSIPFGTDVTVGAYNSKWAFVTVSGKYGFVAVSDLNRTSYSSLSKGSTGSAVSTLEKALLAGGYFDGQPDSTYDSQTEAAVKRFQSACGVTVTGTASEGLQRMLYSGNAPSSSILSATLSKGDSGENVTRLQTRLFALGYLSKSSSIDGDFGTTTAAAVSLFQNCNEISTSSKADSTTLRKLYSTGAATLPSGKLAADQGGTVVQPSSGNQKNNSTTISSTLSSNTSKYSSSMSNAEKLEYVIYVGQNQLGKPYVYGANGTSSYDCTGFTCYCFKQIGISLPRTAVNQGYSDTYTKITSVSNLKRGDLVYFNTVNDSDLSDHAGIYLGAGWFIHASSGQGRVVISTLTSGYYNRVFSWGRRVYD